MELSFLCVVRSPLVFWRVLISAVIELTVVQGLPADIEYNNTFCLRCSRFIYFFVVSAMSRPPAAITLRAQIQSCSVRWPNVH